MVLAAMKYKVHSAAFKKFCKSDTMDTFLHACIEYFAVYFEARKIEEDEAASAEKRRDALASGLEPDHSPTGGASSGAGASKLLLEKEMEQRARRRDIALVYASILLTHSNYANTQQERAFFESLYDFSKRVLFSINNRKHWHAIEDELDRVFRSQYFNLSQRKNSSAKNNSSAQVSFKELYEKYGGAEGFGRAAGGGGPRRSSIHKALLMRSPIISEIFPTATDRAAREAELARTTAEHHADADAEDGEYGGTMPTTHASMRNSMRGSTGAMPGTAEVPGMALDGEDAMEALVQETSRSFSSFVG